MSTELFDAKGIADEIHYAANVPESRNPEVYIMTVQMLGQMVGNMDKYGLTMAEQRRRISAKKDELIGELRALVAQGKLYPDPDRPHEPVKRKRGRPRKIQMVN